MKLRIHLGILSIALTAIMFAAGPIVVEHEAFAFSHHGGAYAFYGPCIQAHGFSYTWCLNPF
jgi:hypothetical protein